MRKLAVAIAVAMASGRVNALGLGDIELHSALNEPLNAEVRLLAEQPGELNNAVVRLAPNDEFARAGIDRSGVLSDINFTIARHDDGTSVVKITSTQPIREPFLDFIVQLRWQSGQLLREYTVLLDPPVFGEEKAAPVSAPVVESPAAPAAAVTAPVPAPEQESAPAPTAATEAPASQAKAPAPRQSQQRAAAAAASAKAAQAGMAGAKSYGPTRRTETLWTIASSLRPDDSVSVYQMMMALLKENPDAFYDHNVNNLMAGYVLRVPDKAAVMAIDETQAVKEAARQYERWQQSRRGSETVAGSVAAPPAAGAPEAAPQQGGAAPEQDKEKARLRLVAPGDMSAKSATAGGVQAELTRLRGELAIALESSDTAKRESDELRSRVAALEGQINSLQRLLTLKNESLDELQKRSGMTAAPVAPQAAAKTPAPAVTIPPVAPAKPAPVKPAPVKPAPKAIEQKDWLANPTLMGAVAGAGLLLLSVVWLVLRRRRDSEGEVESVGSAGADETLLPPVDVQADQEDFVVGPAVVINPAETQQMTKVAEEVAHGAEQDIPQTTSDLDVLHTAEGDIDPIVEADVYLAYRRYQQAEALVQSALASQPGRQDLQAKLLEIYYAAKNAGSFQTLAQTLYDNLGKNADDPVWQRILPMGRELCPDHALFSSSTEGRAAQQQNEHVGAATSSFGAAASAASVGGGAMAGAAQDEKMEFDLNLGGSTSAEAPAHATAQSLGADLNLAGASATAAGKGVSGAAHGGGAMEDQPQRNPWEIEPATSDFGNVDFGLDDTDLMAGTDVVGTKLDLARAYIDMGDNDSARDILSEVIKEGNDQQKNEAKVLVEKIA